MATIDFITDDEFRLSLTSDLDELEKALENKSIKAAHVLAGSIVEAVLIDYLISETPADRERLLKLDLGKAIDECQKRGVIGSRTANLSSVVREYRNLIHPGLVIRKQEKISDKTAHIANSVVSVILEEIAAIGYHAATLNPAKATLPQEIQDKHYFRKHGPGAYYGQPGSKH